MALEVFLAGLLLGLSAIMLVAAGVAYRRVGGQRLLFITLAFLVFTIKGAVLLAASFLGGLQASLGVPPAILVFDLAILVMLYLAVAKR
jgi:hypothetical protein